MDSEQYACISFTMSTRGFCFYSNICYNFSPYRCYSVLVSALLSFSGLCQASLGVLDNLESRGGQCPQDVSDWPVIEGQYGVWCLVVSVSKLILILFTLTAAAMLGLED